MPHQRSCPLAVASAQRWPELAAVPTLIESGYADFSLDAWAGVVAPAGTPAAVVGKLNAAINAGLAGDEVKAALAKLSALPKTGTPAEFAAFIAAEGPKWAAVVKLAGARIDEASCPGRVQRARQRERNETRDPARESRRAEHPPTSTHLK